MAPSPKRSLKSIILIVFGGIFAGLLTLAISMRTWSNPESFQYQIKMLKAQFKELEKYGRQHQYSDVVSQSRHDQDLLKEINAKIVRRDRERHPSLVNLTEKYPELKEEMNRAIDSVHMRRMAKYDTDLRSGSSGKQAVFVPETQVVLIGSGRQETAIVDSIIAEMARNRGWRVFVFESDAVALDDAVNTRFETAYGVHAVPGPFGGQERSAHTIHGNASLIEYPVILAISTVGFRKPFLAAIHDLGTDMPVRHVLDGMHKLATSFKPEILLIAQAAYKDHHEKASGRGQRKLTDTLYAEKLLKMAKYRKAPRKTNWISGYDVFYFRDYFAKAVRKMKK